MTFDAALAAALRRRIGYSTYAVAYAGSYEEARGCLLDCVTWGRGKNFGKTKKRGGEGKP